MLKENTVFIVAAGASKDYDFPIGDELKESIKGLFEDIPSPEHGTTKYFDEKFKAFSSKNFMYFLSLHNSPVKKEKFIEKGKSFKTLPVLNSIDTYIDNNREDSDIQNTGKLCIIHEILLAERNSSLLVELKPIITDDDPAPDSPIDSRYRWVFNEAGVPNNLDDENIKSGPKLSDTWISVFFRNISKGRTFSELKEEFQKITIICFNYDRCIEFYLPKLVNATYGDADEQSSIELVKSINIIHPYGTIGQLYDLLEPNYVSFGNMENKEINPTKLLPDFRTFTETEVNEPKMTYIKNRIYHSKNFVFLGFGFEEKNVELLTLPSGIVVNNSHNFFATTYGMNELQEEQVRLDINKIFVHQHFGPSKNINLLGQTCPQMLNSLSKTIF